MAQREKRWFRWPLLVALIVLLTVALLLLLPFGVHFYGIEGNAMAPTLEDGDMVVVWRGGFESRQGDIVVFQKAYGAVTGPMIKRVIAVGGQTVHIDYGENSVYVDGVKLSEPYVKEAMREPFFAHNADLTVPEGSVFVLGDNRNNSSDSRDMQLGPVERSFLIGKVLFKLT